MTKIEEARRIAAKYHIIREATITTIAKNLDRTDFDSWLRKLVYRQEHMLNSNARIYERDGKFYHAEIVMLEAGIVWSTACRRLVRWEKGEIDEKQLMEKKKPKYDTMSIKKKIPKSGNIPRDELLARIPGPTELERRLWG